MKYVYLVRAGEGSYKVGVTSNILSRVRALQTSNSELIEVIAAKQTPHAHRLEKALHDRLAKLRHNGGREWFNLTCEEAIKVAIKINQSPGITVSEVQILADLITEQNKRQQEMTGKMQVLLEQARAENIMPKPKVKIVKEVINKSPKNSDEELIVVAKQIVIENKKASTSLLQRKMKIGYGKASRLIDTLEEQGIVGQANGAKPREVLVSN